MIAWLLKCYFGNEWLPMVRSLVVKLVVILGASSAAADLEADLARSVLGSLPAQSFRDNAEYCGYLGFDGGGSLLATPAAKGGLDWCEIDTPEGIEIVASYHTRAEHDPIAWSEVSSREDMEMHEDQGTDGHVSTPGGRLWYIDTEDMIATQICGIGCLPLDPRFQPTPEGNIRQSYSYDALVQKIERYPLCTCRLLSGNTCRVSKRYDVKHNPVKFEILRRINPCYPHRAQPFCVNVGNNPADDDGCFTQSGALQFNQQLLNQRHMTAGKNRQSNDMRTLIFGSSDNFGRR